MAPTILDTAKASIIAYNEKNWDAAMAALGPEVIYDEVATHRNLQGVADVIAAWKAWAGAFPDSRATFNHAHVSGGTVILELTWRGTHTGVLRTAAGEIPATGKRIEIRACQFIEVAYDKTQQIRHYFDMATMLTQLGVHTAGV